MNKKPVSRILLILLLVDMLIFAFNLQPVKTEPTTIVVPDDYEKIQLAVDNASDGDTIFVRAGTYYEHVVVNKSVSLIGEKRRTTIIDGGGDEAYGWAEYGYVVKVEANGVTVTGFTIRNSRQTGRGVGLWLRSANQCKITYNNLVGNFDGIQLDYSSYNIITANEASSNNNRGIFLMETSNNNLITENNVTSNNSDGIELMVCSSNTIAGNNFSLNKHDGILLYSSGGITSNNIIRNNTVTNNNGVGIQLLYGASHNTIVHNNVSFNSLAGIRFRSCHNNTIYHNNFIDNNPQALDTGGDSVNVWDDGYPSGGNYWSDYEERYPNASELDESGIWNTPYIIDENNQDNYPLMNPWTPGEEGSPFWTQWWFWTIIAVGIVALAGAVYTLKRRGKTPMPTAPPLSTEGTQ